MNEVEQAKTAIAAHTSQGRDDMNFAEWPISAASANAPVDFDERGNACRVFADTYYDRDARATVHQTLTVTAGKYDLPTPFDDDVQLALVQITVRKNGFSERKIACTLYEIALELGVKPDGRAYSRIRESMKRLRHTDLNFQKSWRPDAGKKRWLDASFSVFSSVRFRSKGDDADAYTYFEWSAEYFESANSGNLKYLDWHYYRSLRHSIAKRAFRFYDKRLHSSPSTEFDLQHLACEKLGVSRNYRTAKLKEKVAPALQEISDRFTSTFVSPKRGEHRVRVTKVRRQTTQEISTKHHLTGLAKELASRGVNKAECPRLAAMHAPDIVQGTIDLYDWHNERAKDNAYHKKSPGWLRKAIERGDFLQNPPDGFQTNEQRQRKAQKERERAQVEAAAKLEEERLQEQENRQIQQYLDALTPQERSALDDEVFESLPRFGTKQPSRNGGVFQTYLRSAVLQRISDPQSTA